MIAEDRRVDGGIVSGGTVSCLYDHLRCHRWRRGYRLDDLLFSLLDEHNIYTRFHRDICITEMYTIFCKIALLCMDKCLTISLEYSFSFLTESRGSALWRLCRHGWHRELSLRQITVPPVRAGFIGLLNFCFLCSFNMTFTLDFILISALLTVYDNFLYICFVMLG